MSEIITTIISGITSFVNGSVFPALLAGGGVVYFGWMYYKANKVANEYRRKVQQELTAQSKAELPTTEYYVACAGKQESGACRKVSAVDINQCNLCDSDGNPVDLSWYNCYVVHGDSMKYAGIKNDDFILVPTDFNIESLKTFPEILVLRYREQKEGKPLFKVRRAWYIGTINDDLFAVAKRIMEMPKYERLTEQEGYNGAEWMIDDLLNNRLEDYKSIYFEGGNCPDRYREIVISTTFDTDKKEIHFSIHPVSLIVGNVEMSYTIKS